MESALSLSNVSDAFALCQPYQLDLTNSRISPERYVTCLPNLACCKERNAVRQLLVQ